MAPYGDRPAVVGNPLCINARKEFGIAPCSAELSFMGIFLDTANIPEEAILEVRPSVEFSPEGPLADLVRLTPLAKTSWYLAGGHPSDLRSCPSYLIAKRGRRVRRASGPNPPTG